MLLTHDMFFMWLAVKWLADLEDFIAASSHTSIVHVRHQPQLSPDRACLHPRRGRTVPRQAKQQQQNKEYRGVQCVLILNEKAQTIQAMNPERPNCKHS